MSEFIHQGFLSVKSGANWKRKFSVLFNDRIECFNREDDPKPSNVLVLNSSTKVLDLHVKTFGFQVISQKETLMMDAESEEEKNIWQNYILGIINSFASTNSGQNVNVFHVEDTDFILDKRYTFIQSIGKGAYGAVISANDDRTNTKVAIKKIANAFRDLNDTKRIVREIRLLTCLRHENIINMIDILPPPSPDEFNDIYLVYELMETDLKKVIHSHQNLSIDHIKYFLYQIFCALKYIHSAHVIHRDLKPSNILVNSNCDLKICDFGLSRGFNQQGNQPMTEYVVTRWYRAPEIMLTCRCYTGAIDIWSVGCIFAEMLNKEVLFPGTDSFSQLQLITKFETPTESNLDFVVNPKARSYMMNLPRVDAVDFASQFPTVEPDVLDLLSKMLTFNPNHRISIEEAIEHPFLRRLHDVESEPLAEEPINCSEIESANLTRHNLQRFIYEDLCIYHPECQVELDKFNSIK